MEDIREDEQKEVVCVRGVWWGRRFLDLRLAQRVLIDLQIIDTLP